MDTIGTIRLKKNDTVNSQQVAVAPLASELEFGELAINYNPLDPCLFFKDKAGKIVKIVDENVIVDTLKDILGGAATDLDTLKELLAEFASSDLATVQASILSRLDQLDIAVANKADRSALNAHINNSSNPHSVTKAQVGLSNVDNTSDVNKPVSTAQRTAIDDAKNEGTQAKAALALHTGNTSNPHNTTKAQIGLGNVVDKEQLGKTETAVNSEALGHTLNGCNEGVAVRSTLQFGTSLQKTSDDKAGVNGFPTVNNANAVITMDMATGNWFGQLGFSGNGQLYHRTFYTKDIANAKDSWALLYTSQNINKSDVDWTCKDLISRNVTAKGDIVAKSSDAVIFTTEAQGGAGNLFELNDVDIPLNPTDNFVLMYNAKEQKWVANKVPNHNHDGQVYASDENLKEGIVDMRDAMVMINNMKPKTYHWNKAAEELNLGHGKAYGLIAQEVELLYPEIVKSIAGTPYKGIDYVKIIPILISAIQEQNEVIGKISSMLKTYERRQNKAVSDNFNDNKRITELEKQIEELKQIVYSGFNKSEYLK